MPHLKGQRKSVPHFAVNILPCHQLPLAQSASAGPLYDVQQGVGRECMVVSPSPARDASNRVRIQCHPLMIILDEMSKRFRQDR